MKRIVFAFLLTLLVFIGILAGCSGGNMETKDYRQISQEEAKQMMDMQEDAVVVDVREQDEFDAGHIPGAVLLPVGDIDETAAAAVIPAKDTPVLVYCRSGNRSKTASQALVELGYTQVYEFGGINSWPYETER